MKQTTKIIIFVIATAINFGQLSGMGLQGAITNEYAFQREKLIQLMALKLHQHFNTVKHSSTHVCLHCNQPNNNEPGNNFHHINLQIPTTASNIDFLNIAYRALQKYRTNIASHDLELDIIESQQSTSYTLHVHGKCLKEVESEIIDTLDATTGSKLIAGTTLICTGLIITLAIPYFLYG